MRILILSHRLPFPPRTGDKVRCYHIARSLARQHEVTLACLADEADAASAVSALRREIPDLLCAPLRRWSRRGIAFLRLLGGESATFAYFDSSRLREELASRLRVAEPDLVYVSSSSMAQYVPEWTTTPVIVDFVDVDSEKWAQYGHRLPAHRRWVYRLEAARLRARERAAALLASRCIVSTPREEALLRAIAPTTRTVVVPNGVDLAYFSPAPTAVAEPMMVFTGAMNYFPNVDAVTYFARSVLPAIRNAIPGARFLVVGKDPAPEVRRLAVIPGIEVTGSVPDVRPFIRRAAVAVAPVRLSRGVQNKILEAMASGLPVVTTSAAHEALPSARPGHELFVEDEPAAFADAVVRLLRAPSLAQAVGREARRYVEEHYSWTASTRQVNELVQELASMAARPSLVS